MSAMNSKQGKMLMMMAVLIMLARMMHKQYFAHQQQSMRPDRGAVAKSKAQEVALGTTAGALLGLAVPGLEPWISSAAGFLAAVDKAYD